MMKNKIYYYSLRKLVFLFNDVFLLFISLSIVDLLSAYSSFPASSLYLLFLSFALLWGLISQRVVHRKVNTAWTVYLKDSVTSLFYTFLFHFLLFSIWVEFVQLQTNSFPYLIYAYTIPCGLTIVKQAIYYCITKKSGGFKNRKNKFSVVRSTILSLPYNIFLIKRYEKENVFTNTFLEKTKAARLFTFVKELANDFNTFSLRESIVATYSTLSI